MSLLEGLQEYPIQPFVVVPREGGLANALLAQNIPYKMVPVVYWMIDKPLSRGQRKKHLQVLFQSVKAIQRIIQEWEIDLVYTNTSVTPVGRLAAWRERIPHIWHIREFGDLDYSLKFIFPKFLSYKFIQSSQAVICHAKVIRDHHFRTEAKRVHLVYNGSVTRHQFDVLLEKKSDARGHSGFVFSILSSITPKKGQETAIQAVSKIHQRGIPVKLVIAGDGKTAYVDHCMQLVDILGLSKVVEFKGFVDDPYELYLGSDCVLICSEHEAFSRTALEAMATGLPVIGKNSGGTPEIIEHEKTGLLYNSFDQLVAVMLRVVQNPDWGRQLGLNGWQSAKERFNIENYAAKVYQVIQSVSGFHQY